MPHVKLWIFCFTFFHSFWIVLIKAGKELLLSSCSNCSQCSYPSSRLNWYYSAACWIIHILSQCAFNLGYDYLNVSFFVCILSCVTSVRSWGIWPKSSCRLNWQRISNLKLTLELTLTFAFGSLCLQFSKKRCYHPFLYTKKKNLSWKSTSCTSF